MYILELDVLTYKHVKRLKKIKMNEIKMLWNMLIQT